MAENLPYKLWFADAGVIRADRNGIDIQAVVYEEGGRSYNFMIYGERTALTNKISYTMKIPSELSALCAVGESCRCQDICNMAVNCAKQRYSTWYENIVLDSSDHRCKYQ